MSLLHGRISCQEFVEFASDYLQGELTPVHRRAVERHLAECPDCPNYLAQLRLTVALTGRLRTQQVPAELLEVLTRAFEETQVRQHPDDEP